MRVPRRKFSPPRGGDWRDRWPAGLRRWARPADCRRFEIDPSRPGRGDFNPHLIRPFSSSIGAASITTGLWVGHDSKISERSKASGPVVHRSSASASGRAGIFAAWGGAVSPTSYQLARRHSVRPRRGLSPPINLFIGASSACRRGCMRWKGNAFGFAEFSCGLCRPRGRRALFFPRPTWVSGTPSEFHAGCRQQKSGPGGAPCRSRDGAGPASKRLIGTRSRFAVLGVATNRGARGKHEAMEIPRPPTAGSSRNARVTCGPSRGEAAGAGIRGSGCRLDEASSARIASHVSAELRRSGWTASPCTITTTSADRAKNGRPLRREGLVRAVSCTRGCISRQ